MIGVENIKRSLNLPTADNEGQVRLLIFDAFILLGEELGQHYNSILEPILGKSWVYDLSKQRNVPPFNMIDPDWVLKEPLRNSTSPTRRALPKGQGFYNQINLLAKTRNAYFHNQGNGSLDAALQVMQLLLDFTLAIPLPICASEYAQALQRLKKLQNGEVFIGGEAGLERIQLLEQQVAELEELANQNKRDIQIKQLILDGAMGDVALQDERLRELLEKVGDKEQAVSLARREQEEAEGQVKALQQDYENKVAELAAKEAIERQYKELLAAVVKSETVQSMLKSTANKAETGTSPIKPGAIWLGQKGSHRLTLSVNFRELYDTKTGALLRETYGAAATELAAEWLEIKPQGGRVFIDEDGTATSYRGEELIYLGKTGFKIC